MYKKIAIIKRATMILLTETAVLFPNHAMTANTTNNPTAAAVLLIERLGKSGVKYMANSVPNRDTMVGIRIDDRDTNTPA